MDDGIILKYTYRYVHFIDLLLLNFLCIVYLIIESCIFLHFFSIWMIIYFLGMKQAKKHIKHNSFRMTDNGLIAAAIIVRNENSFSKYISLYFSAMESEQ